VNAKVRRLARRSALSAKAKAGKIIVVEDFTFSAPKTKDFTEFLRALNVADQKPLTVLGAYDKTLYLSCRNIEKATIHPATDISTYQILHAGTLVILESAIEKIKETCA
jgi:large subunit ribosomal protein L4